MNKEQRIKSVIKQVSDYVYGDQETDNGFIEYIAQQYDGTIRENSVKAKFGLQDFDPVDGFGLKLDAFNPEDGKSVEIKCTQKETGGLMFSFKATHDKVDMMEKLNPWIYGAGFDPISGRCAYTLRFRYKGTEVAQRMREDCDKEKRGTKTPNRPSSWNHYITSKSLEILHFSPKIAKETLCGSFFNALAAKFYQNYSKDDLIAMLINGTTPSEALSSSVQSRPSSEVDLIISNLREQRYKVSQIVDHLNNLGFKTGAGKSWTVNRLYSYNYCNKKKTIGSVKSDYQSRVSELFNKNLSNSKIAMVLNDEGYTTQRGTKWRRASVALHTNKLRKAA